MVIKTQKTNIVGVLSIFMILLIVAFLIGDNSFAEKVKFEVDVTEVLSVSLTTPDTWASGNVSIDSGSDLLRNKVNLSVTSNNPTGFAAFMASKTTTNLVNTSKSSSVIETLSSSSTAGSFPANRWGYSIDDTDAGSAEANYSALQTSQIAVLNSTSPTTDDQDIFFGAKADATKDSGTYANTVVFSVISGYVPNDPTPDDPVYPSDDTPNDGEATYDGTRTIYTNTSANSQDGTTTTNTKISPGDTRDAYENPQGVNTNVNNGNNLATGLAVAAAVAATSGAAFFILAKRKKNDDEDEEEI